MRSTPCTIVRYNGVIVIAELVVSGTQYIHIKTIVEPLFYG